MKRYREYMADTLVPTRRLIDSDMERLSVLWLTRIFPYPPAQGGDIIYSRSLIEAAASAGAKICVLYAVGNRVSTETTDVGSVEWINTGAGDRPLWRSLLSSLPNSAARYYSHRFKKVLEFYLSAREWHAVVFDHFGMLGYVPHVVRWTRRRKMSTQLVYLSHNHEESVRWALTHGRRDAFPGKLALALDAIKGTHAERTAIRHCDLVTTITDTDRSLFERRNPHGRYLVLQPGYDGPRTSRREFSSTDRLAVVLGTYLWIAKRQNLEEFLDEASRFFPPAGIRLRVVGSMDEAYRAALRRKYSWAEIVGTVDEPATELASARIGIVPERIGGGFKFKILNYVFNRNAVASLESAMTGLPLKPDEHYISGRDMQTLCKNIVAHMDRLDLLEQMSSRAYAICETVFDWSDRGEAFTRTLRNPVVPV